MSENLTRAFAAVVNERRTAGGFSLRGLASAAGLSHAALGEKIRADRSISLRDVEALADTFGMRPSELVAEAEKELTR